MKQCNFCTNNAKSVDYKEFESLKKFLGAQGRISTKKETGLCSKHQRSLARAVKNARFLGLLPFVAR